MKKLSIILLSLFLVFMTGTSVFADEEEPPVNPIDPEPYSVVPVYFNKTINSGQVSGGGVAYTVTASISGYRNENSSTGDVLYFSNVSFNGAGIDDSNGGGGYQAWENSSYQTSVVYSGALAYVHFYLNYSYTTPSTGTTTTGTNLTATLTNGNTR